MIFTAFGAMFGWIYARHGEVFRLCVGAFARVLSIKYPNDFCAYPPFFLL
ncbi:hypothetical protein C7382_1242 [Porphyromonas loveana]|uniref:Uncharacterized protein n=1 Tax=Porphyromonas loveana TaxID=1884669 RepID=A0A2U1F138_9PORP|nr:hypothetical protein C7382_1242 [Porphyromonas loveana]